MQVDLRSDTVTTPTSAMLRAMAAAEVGDDVYAEDPTVNRLQALLAEMTGLEAGLFVPSGTMSNQIALAVHCPRGSEVILPEGAHVYDYEPGAMAVIAGVLPRLVKAPGGAPAAQDVSSAIGRSKHRAPTALISLENTHNGSGGAVVSLEQQHAVQAVARQHGLPIHLDGARAFNAATALGVGIDQVCAGFDSVSVCLSKGLGAPVGSVLLGTQEFVGRAHRYRKLLGGGMRQAGVLAAAGLVALQEMPAALAADHARARRLAEGLAGAPGLTLDMQTVQSNMVYIGVKAPSGEGAADAFAAACQARGVRFNAMDAVRARLVTHHQVDDQQIQVALAIMLEEAERLARAPHAVQA